MRCETQRLLRADAEESLAAECAPEESDGAILKLAIEVDEHVPARHELHFGKHTVRCEAVIREDDVLLQGFVQHSPPIRRRVVLRERYGATRPAVVLCEAGDAIRVV